MPKFSVGLVACGTVWVDVDAESSEDARSQAYEQASFGLCHQCAGKVEMDDWTGEEVVLDENGDEVERVDHPSTSSQQEHEVGLVAHIEALRGALESAEEAHDCGLYDDGCALCVLMREALARTPPAALAQQRERMAKLEAVAEAARDYDTWRHDPGTTDEYLRELLSNLGDAIAALDAERGQA